MYLEALKSMNKQYFLFPCSWHGEITKINAEINKLETKQTIQRISETNCWFFEKIKIDKPLAK